MSSNLKIRRICQHCGQEFVARTTVTRYCGDYCAKKAYKLRGRKLQMSDPHSESPNFVPSQIKTSDNYFELKTFDYLTVKESAKM